MQNRKPHSQKAPQTGHSILLGIRKTVFEK